MNNPLLVGQRKDLLRQRGRSTGDNGDQGEIPQGLRHPEYNTPLRSTFQRYAINT